MLFIHYSGVMAASASITRTVVTGMASSTLSICLVVLEREGVGECYVRKCIGGMALGTLPRQVVGRRYVTPLAIG